MDKPKVTPKDFFLWAGAMIALYVSVFSLISLLFAYIDKTFPDALNYYVDPYSSGMRFSIASLIVLFPLFLVLMRFIRKDMVRDESRKDIWVRRWALVMTIFVAGASIAGDLIALVNTFLGGEITTRFFLKVVVVLLIASVGLMHFLADLWGYWFKFPERARYVGWGIGALILLTIGAGFIIMGSPNQIRLYRFDDQKVSDLQNIQYQIINYWQTKQKLPAKLSDLNDSLQNFSVPVDQQNGQQYRFEATGNTSFKLCATFNAETQTNSPYTTRAIPAPASMGEKGAPVSDNWFHGSGEVCFDRTIDPERYPPFTKSPPIK